MELGKRTVESGLERVAQAEVKNVLEALAVWERMAEAAYSKNTRRAMKADGAVFQAFCEKIGESFFPASPGTIRAFIENCVLVGKKPATIRRYVATISRVHTAASISSPSASEQVRLALKEMGQKTSARQRQALALGWKEIKEFISTAGEGLRADRERALLSVAYDTMARRSELVAFDLKDVTFMPNGTGSILIRRSKTDQASVGTTAYLSRETVRLLAAWLKHSGIADNDDLVACPIFRRLIGRHRVGQRLHKDMISDIFKRVARWIGMSANRVAGVSGHSVRIGATQDLLALDIDLVSVMQAGRWKSTQMPMRYGEAILAARSAMARAAKAQGRDNDGFA